MLVPMFNLQASSAQDTGKILRVHQTTDPDVVDPQKSSFTNEIAILSLNYEGLTRLDSDGNTVPAAAESWEFNADGTVLTFHLRAGLTYSDGAGDEQHGSAQDDAQCGNRTQAVERKFQGQPVLILVGQTSSLSYPPTPVPGRERPRRFATSATREIRAPGRKFPARHMFATSENRAHGSTLGTPGRRFSPGAAASANHDPSATLKSNRSADTPPPASNR